MELFWIEEPFRETVDDYQKLRSVLKDLDIQTLLADGEAAPDQAFLRKLIDLKLLDVHLTDIQELGFTGWRNLIPKLEKEGAGFSTCLGISDKNSRDSSFNCGIWKYSDC